MSQTNFILTSTPSSNTLPSSPNLSLLPFSLGPRNAPYTSHNAPIGRYFCPRPWPLPETETAASVGPRKDTRMEASFRGRRLVGQYVPVPPTYRGVILSTSLPPNKGGLETHASSSHVAEGAPAPAPSAPSDSASGEKHGEEAGGRPRRSAVGTAAGILAKVKGAGQVALTRPRTRRAAASKAGVPAKTRKRVRLESDSEGEPEVRSGPGPSFPEGTATHDEASVSSRTPSKRARSFGVADTAPCTPVTVAQKVPEIRIQEATPLKHPFPAVESPVRAHAPTRSEIIRHSQSLPNLSEEAELGPSATDEVKVEVTEVVEVVEVVEGGEVGEVGDEERQAGPTFHAPPPPSHSPEKEEQVVLMDEVKEGTEEETYEGPVRLLKPVSQFEGIMLWSGDVPVAGYTPSDATPTATTSESSVPKTEPEPNTTFPNEPKIEELGQTRDIQVRASWWPVGGSGEGGDEYIRGMGEFLGLMDTLNKPVYLEGLDESDDDDE